MDAGAVAGRVDVNASAPPKRLRALRPRSIAHHYRRKHNDWASIGVGERADAMIAALITRPANSHRFRPIAVACVVNVVALIVNQERRVACARLHRVLLTGNRYTNPTGENASSADLDHRGVLAEPRDRQERQAAVELTLRLGVLRDRHAPPSAAGGAQVVRRVRRASPQSQDDHHLSVQGPEPSAHMGGRAGHSESRQRNRNGRTRPAVRGVLAHLCRRRRAALRGSAGAGPRRVLRGDARAAAHQRRRRLPAAVDAPTAHVGVLQVHEEQRWQQKHGLELPGLDKEAMAEQQQQPKKEKTSLELFKQSFREYLKETSAVPNDDELDQLMALLHEPLPVSFRVNLHRPDAQRVQKLLATELQFPENTFFHNDTPITPPKPIAWYPLANVAWQVDCGRTALSKSAPKHEAVKAFHSCLLEHTEMGTIDRQEAVSMLPVLFLDVQPAQRVLDMCASPGSKTTQVIDFLLSASPDTETSNGMVIANDLDKKRAYMLVHRLTRNTLRNAVVTCGAGDLFPGLYDKANGKLQPTNVFDRVLCDVPCSGDGTLRKNQALWKEWHIGQGLTLHPIQLSLALRGAALLKIGGVMVYSTCSFNPVENEAVVAELLRRSGGALELVDVSQKLPTLIYRKGRTKWNVGWRSKSKSTHKGHLFKANSGDNGENGESATTSKTQLHEWFGSYDDIPQELRGQRVVRSMFTPANSDPIALELEKTLRLIPTDQNSGGFFIAVLRKKANLPGKKQEGLPALAENIDLTPPVDYVCKLCNDKGHFLKNCEKYIPETKFAAAEQTPKTKKQRTEEASEADDEKKMTKKKNKSNEPYVKPRETLYRPISDDAWELIKEFYGIQDAGLKARFWCRSDGAANVNYVDEEISDACLGGDALEIVNTGLKVFTKLAEKGVTYYRPSEEALGFIDNFFTKRIIKLTSEDFALLLQATAHLSFESLVSASAQEFLAGAGIGPGVAQLETNKNVSFNVWIGKNAILPRVSKTMRAEVEQALKLNA